MRKTGRAPDFENDIDTVLTASLRRAPELPIVVRRLEKSRRSPVILQQPQVSSDDDELPDIAGWLVGAGSMRCSSSPHDRQLEAVAPIVEVENHRLTRRGGCQLRAEEADVI